MSYQKVLTFHCYKPDFAWVGRDIGKTFACFKCDEFGLLDKDLTLVQILTIACGHRIAHR